MEIKRVHLPQVIAIAERLDLFDAAYGITKEERKALNAMRDTTQFSWEEEEEF